MSTPVEEFQNPFEDHLDMSNPSSQAGPSEANDHADQDSTSIGGNKPKEKKRVGFNENKFVVENVRSDRTDVHSLDGTLLLPDPTSWSIESSVSTTPLDSPTGEHGLGDASLSSAGFRSPRTSFQETEQSRVPLFPKAAVVSEARPRPAIRRTGSPKLPKQKADLIDDPGFDGHRTHQQLRAREAFEKAKKLERDQQSTFKLPPREDSPGRKGEGYTRSQDMPLNQHYDHSDDDSEGEYLEMPALHRVRRTSNAEAYGLVRRHTNGHGLYSGEIPSGIQSGAVTPTEEMHFAEDYKPQPSQYRGGVLGALLKLYNQPHTSGQQRSPSAPGTPSRQNSLDLNTQSALSSPQHSPPASGTTTPNGSRHWYSIKHRDQSSSSLATLIGTPSTVSGLGEQVSQRLKERRDHFRRPRSSKGTHSSGTRAALHRLSRPRLEEEIRITVHIAEIISRQKYLQKLCRALMQYGAPTHRLEEYMRMSARVLETNAQFLYIPGAMIMSFEDRETHTSEVRLVKVAQGLDLGKLRDVHEIYKEVVHDRIGVEEATQRLSEVSSRGEKFSRRYRVLMFGLAAVCVGPFAFGARLIDLPIAFFLGCILGVLQLYIAPRSDLYANVFEVTAAVVTSFLARGFGSIYYPKHNPEDPNVPIFCFSALAQSSIALILPGYTVLCASLELQSRSIVAGSVRMVYAVIYSLFLGFGITIGTAIYGTLDPHATSETTCSEKIPEYWFFFFVPGFAMCLIIINQAKWKQAPVMLVIAFAGYVVNYFSSRRFQGNTQVSNTLGALVIGTLANLYSRLGGRVENWFLDLWEDRLRSRWRALRKRIFGTQGKEKSAKALEDGTAGHGDNESVFVRQTRRVGYSLAAAAMLPAIFVQVPSGLAVNGSLVAGIASADQITSGATNGTSVVNSTNLYDSSSPLNSVAFNVTYSVIQVAIGITVGLFLSAICVYPLGKRRSGLFSF